MPGGIGHIRDMVTGGRYFAQWGAIKSMTDSAGDASQTGIVVYFNGTFLNLENGAHARMYDQLKWLSARFSDIALYSYSNHPDCPWTEKEETKFRVDFPHVRLVLEHRPAGLRYATRLKNALLTLAPDLFRQIFHWRVPGTPLYRSLTRSNPVLFVNYADALSELNGVDPARIVVETHDLKFLNYAKKMALPVSHLRVVGKFRNETAVLNNADALIAISPQEMAFFRALFPGKPVFYIPAYDVSPSVVEGDWETAEYDVLFVASENALNIVGITDFLQNNPWIRRYRLAIAGRICGVAEVSALAAQRENIALLGYVEDLRPIYAKTKIAISPVDGTGLKVKVIDALSAGVPVLGSDHTVDGLPPGSRDCVFPLTEAWAARLLEDADALGAARKAALSFSQTIAELGDTAGLFLYLESKRQPVDMPGHVPPPGGELAIPATSEAGSD